MSWKKVRIGDFLIRSKIPIDIENEESYKRVTIRIKHQGVSLRDEEIGKKIGTKKQFVLKKGQFVMSKIDARYGAFGIAPSETDGAIITGNFWAYDVDIKVMNINWLTQYTNSPAFYDLCERASSGITHRKYLNEKLFLKHELLIPEVNEQDFQVEFVENRKELFGKSTYLQSYQLDLLKKLRQQILQDAVQGKLVPQDHNDEPASKLLERIKAEKARLVEEGKIKKEKPSPEIKPEEIPFEIPKNWVWCKASEISANKPNALKAGPFGSSLKKEYYTNTGYKIYGQEQVINQDPSYGDYYIGEDRFQMLKSCAVSDGDILISLVGTMGKVLILPEGIEKGIINPRLVKISLFEEINRQYIKNYLYSIPALQQIKHFSHGSTMDIINLGILKRILIPLPPLPEQHRIVTKIEKLFALFDELEQSIQQNKKYAQDLLQVVLKEALEPK